MVAASIWSSSEDAIRLVSQSHGVSLVRITDYSSPLGSRVYVGYVQAGEFGAPLPRTLTASSHSFSRVLDRFYLPVAGDPNAAAALFDAIADSYEMIVNREQNLRLNEVLLSSCLQALGPDRPLTVLDFGCGPGFSVQALSNLGANARRVHLVGTDASAAMMGVVARIVTGPHDANRQDPHLPMRYDAGRPRAVIRLRIAQPRTTSLACPAGLRARRRQRQQVSRCHHP